MFKGHAKYFQCVTHLALLKAFINPVSQLKWAWRDHLELIEPRSKPIFLIPETVLWDLNLLLD